MVDLTDDEFGRIFERGMSGRANGKVRTPEPCYKNDQRRMAWRDGWDAADVAINNPSLPDTAETIINALSKAGTI